MLDLIKLLLQGLGAKWSTMLCCYADVSGPFKILLFLLGLFCCCCCCSCFLGGWVFWLVGGFFCDFLEVLHVSLHSRIKAQICFPWRDASDVFGNPGRCQYKDVWHSTLQVRIFTVYLFKGRRHETCCPFPCQWVKGHNTLYSFHFIPVDIWFFDSLQQKNLLFFALQSSDKFSDNRNPYSSALCYQTDVTKISPCKLWKLQRNEDKLHFPIKQKLHNR